MAEQTNTFDGVNRVFPNEGIHFMCSEIMTFRKQLTLRSEFRSQSGWSDAMNVWMKSWLEKLADTLESITYRWQDKPLEEYEARAADTTASLADFHNERSLHADDIVMPSGVDRTIQFILDGTDIDIPQMTEANCPNDHARAFIAGLDKLFVEMTNLDSRFQPYTIQKYQSAMMIRLLDNLWTICERKGGEKNMADIPTGTLPSQRQQQQGN